MPNAAQNLKQQQHHTTTYRVYNGRVNVPYAPQYDLRREMLGGIALRNPTAIKFVAAGR